MIANLIDHTIMEILNFIEKLKLIVDENVTKKEGWSCTSKVLNSNCLDEFIFISFIKLYVRA